MNKADETSRLLSIALDRRVRSSETRLVIPWSKSRTAYVVMKKDLSIFRFNLDDREVQQVFDSIRRCKYYAAGFTSSKKVRNLYIIFQILLSFLWISFLAFLFVFRLANKPLVIVTFIVYMGLLSISYFLYLNKSMQTVKSKLKMREKSIKAQLNRINNQNYYWIDNGLIWRCGKFGAYLLL